MSITWLMVDGYNIHRHSVYLWKFRLRIKAASNLRLQHRTVQRVNHYHPLIYGLLRFSSSIEILTSAIHERCDVSYIPVD